MACNESCGDVIRRPRSLTSIAAPGLRARPRAPRRHASSAGRPMSPLASRRSRCGFSTSVAAPARSLRADGRPPAERPRVASGVDPADRDARASLASAAEGIEQFIQADAEQLPFEDGHFDLVVEHHLVRPLGRPGPRRGRGTRGCCTRMARSCSPTCAPAGCPDSTRAGPRPHAAPRSTYSHSPRAGLADRARRDHLPDRRLPLAAFTPAVAPSRARAAALNASVATAPA